MHIIIFFYLDGTNFRRYLGSECDNHDNSNMSLADALMACSYDTNCSMITSYTCSNEATDYQLCGHDFDLTDNHEACTYRKKGILSSFIEF